jgi:hypothetical protein
MIHKEDLRLGNYISYEYTTHEVLSLTALTIKHKWLSDPNIYSTSYNEINGMRITEEFLEKTGWTQEKLIFNDDCDNVWIKIHDNQQYRFKLEDYPLENSNCGYLMVHYPYYEGKSYDEDGNEVPVVFEASTVTISWGIYYIHQLQNLWYSITKEELKYESNT